ncbi:hypothetical protein BSO19_25130 [Escherichia coli]|nr:hypothetical protein AQF51_19375 [Escherichia coli]OJZ23221.1 hypothetical protein BSO19_25130 [Escherichia coli]ROK61078.1 hypothetical protein BFD54_17140 [Escherichia coli]
MKTVPLQPEPPTQDWKTRKSPITSRVFLCLSFDCSSVFSLHLGGNDSNLLIVFYVQIMPDDFVMQLHRF